jgi:RHS repeat-associated protein
VRGGETVHQAYTRGGDLLWERSSNGTTRKYARVGGRLIGEAVNGSRLAIHTDVIGSVRQKTNAFGSAVHEDIRAPYGSTLIGRSYQNGPAFTGHMEDGGTGLTYMKARYYDPVAMRFISPDPVYVDLSTGGNFNRYWYANNNPYSYTDPDGRVAKVLIPATIAGGLCLRNPIACQRTIERTAAMVRVGITGGRLLTEIQDTDSVTGGSDDERIPSSTGTRELGDLETIHAPGHPQNDPKIGELSDRDLEESIKNPTAGDKITVKGNRVLDGNTRINEAKSRGWPSDTTIPVEELPETPKNIDENPLGPYRDF